MKFLLANDFKVEKYCALEANVLGHIFLRSFHLSVHSFSQALSNDHALTLTLILWILQGVEEVAAVFHKICLF